MGKASVKGLETKQEIMAASYMSNEPGAPVFCVDHKSNKQSTMYIKTNNLFKVMLYTRIF